MIGSLTHREFQAFLIPNDFFYCSVGQMNLTVPLKRGLEPKFHFCDFGF